MRANLAPHMTTNICPMHLSLARLACALALIAGGAPAAADPATAPPAGAPPAASAPLSVYGQLPFMENVALSPDGTRFAFSTNIANDETAVIVTAISDLHQVAAVRAGEQKVRGISWADDDDLLIESSAKTMIPGWTGEDEEIFQLYACQVSTGKILDLMDRNFGMSESARALGYIIDSPRARRSGDKTSVYVTGQSLAPMPTGGTWSLPTLFRINLGASTGGVVDTGDVGSSSWLLDESAHVVASETHSMLTERWSIRLRTAAGSRELLKGEAALDFPWLAGLGPDGNSLWIHAPVDGPTRWQSIAMQEGASPQPVPDSAQYESVLVDRRTDRIVGVMIGEDPPRYRFFDPQVEQGWEAAYRAVAGMNPRLVSWSDDLHRFAVRLQTRTAGVMYVLVDATTGKVSGLGPLYKGLTGIAEVRRIEYPAADGLQIPGYLTLPPGREAKGLPLVVLPHGGPESRDTNDFHWLPQALAMQGYAVLQPNFRGSTRSADFIARGYGQWGRKMQTDLSDGVAYLAAQGLVDPRRVCIVGGSYGGYAALAGAALQPGVYRCAASIAGLSDLRRWMQDVRGTVIRNSPSEQYVSRWLGASSPADPKLAEISPIEHVDAISIPVLLIHGRDDTRVKYEQSRLLAEAMQRARKQVTLVDLPHEDHFLSRSSTRLRALEALVDFLRANNPP
jgi:dipeptidyl aminopeptidase/acylaminoacyl peptidase